MKNISKWQIVIIAIAAIIVLSAAAIYYYYTETKEIRKEKYQYLHAIAQLKIDQISKWRNERLSEAEFFPTVGRFIKSTVFLSENPNDQEAKAFLLQTLGPIKQRHNYKNLLITDLNNRILFSIDPDEKKLDSITITYSNKSVELDSITFTDFYFCKTHSNIHLDIVSPIKDNDGSIIGTFILRFDPNDFLFPLIQDWPTPTKTAESLIFKKENDQIRFISDLKYKNNYEMNLTIPITSTEYVAVKGALGKTGIVEGIDYRGVEVLADLNRIPGTTWHFVSKIDKDEIYSEMFYRGRAISLLTVVTFLFVMALAMYFIRSKQSSTYKNLFLKEKELSDTREEFKTALYSIGDAVITTDSAGRIRYMNSVAEQITGWNEIEARGQDLGEVFKIVNEDSNLKIESPVDKVLRDGTIVSLANHTLLIKKDGTRIPISDSGSPIKDDNNKVVGVVLVFRDQTDERAKEKSILESNDKFSKIFNSSSESISLTQMATGKVVEVNYGFVEMFGYNRDEVIGFSTIDLGLWTNPSERERMISILKTEGSIKNFEATGKRKNQELFTALISGELVFIDNEQMLLLTIRDITDRKKLEAALKTEKDRINAILNLVGDPIFVKDNKHRFTLGNKAFYEMVGFDENKVIGKTLAEDIPEDEMEHFLKIDRLVLDTGIPDMREEELTINNQTRTIITNKTRFVDNSGNRLLIGSIHDITDRVNAEKEKTHFNDLMEYFISNTKSAVSVFDTQMNYIYVSDRYYDDFHLTDKNIIGRNHYDVFPDLPQFLRDIHKRSLTGETLSGEDDRLIHPDGSMDWANWTSMPWFKTDGKIGGIIIYIEVLTSQKIAEESLRASEQKYRMLLDFASDAFFQGDGLGNFIYVNNKAIDLTGYSSEELLKMNMKDLFPKEVIENTPLRYDKLLAGDTIKIERVIVKKDGTKIPIEMTSKQMPDGTYQSFVRDLTEYKKTKKEHEAAEHRFRLAFTTSPDSININRLSDGRYVTVNNGFTKMTGYTEDEVIGKTSAEIQIWADIKYRNELVEKLKTTSIVDNFEAKFRMKDGAVKDGLMSASVIELNGEPHIISITRDITDRKKADEILRLSETNLKNSQRVARIGHYDFNVATGIWTSSEMLDEIFGISDTFKHDVESWIKLLHPDDKEMMMNHLLNDVIKNKNIFNKVYRIVRHNNKEVKWVYGLGKVELDKNNNVIRMFGTIQDITELKMKEEEVLKTKIHYQKLIENAPDGIVQISLEGKFKYVSPSAKKIFGHPLNQRVEAKPDSLTHPEDLPLVLNTLNKIINDPSLIQTIQYRFKHTNNSWIWIESTFTNLLNEPSVDAIVINFRDITERRKMEEAVQHSETKFYSIFENSPNAIFITDPESLLIIDCNANACSMNGYTREELIGKSINILHPQNVSDSPADSNLRQEQIELLRMHRSITIESLHKRKDGTVFPIESSISLISLSGKEVTMGIDRDITDRKKLLTEIIGSEEKFRSIWENSVDAMRLVDENGVIINVNDSYCNLFGLNKEDLIGNIFNVSYTITESDTSLKGFKERFKNGTILKKFETEIKLNSGKEIWVELTNSFIQFEDKPAMLLSIIRDITDRKVLITELTAAKEKAEEMIRLKSYFFANMSHELRTPFVGILGFAEILKDTLQNADEREYAEQILKSSKRLTDTLNKILNVTRLEFDKVDLKYKEFDVCSLLKSIEAFYHNSAKLNNTTINTVLENESIIIKSDAKLLEDILNNLVNNAVKFTRDGSIILSASKTILNNKNYLTIKVEDNGIGIPKEKQYLVWQEFRQASEGLNRSFEGTGLGLTITKKYVEILGGEISLESEENIGTIFTINIPADHHYKMELEVADKDHVHIKPAIERPKNKRYKILYVEDDVVALQFINIILKSMYDVETAFKAATALEFVQRVQYDVLMLDINLGSGMDGVELMQKIRQMDYYKNIPIVAVTAYAAQSDKKEFLDKGFTHYISKPFTKNELFSLLKEMLSNQS